MVISIHLVYWMGIGFSTGKSVKSLRKQPVRDVASHLTGYETTSNPSCFYGIKTSLDHMGDAPKQFELTFSHPALK